MTDAKRPEEVTLLDLLIDGFEKNEVFDGFHERVLPLRDEQLAKARFSSLSEEARRWKGTPIRTDQQAAWELVEWADLGCCELAGRLPCGSRRRASVAGGTSPERGVATRCSA